MAANARKPAFLITVVKTIINNPFGNSLQNLFTVKLGMVYYCFTNIIYIYVCVFLGCPSSVAVKLGPKGARLFHGMIATVTWGPGGH